MSKTLTPKQETFCRAMLTAESSAEAYRRAGYGAKARDVSANASRLLAQPHVASRLRQLRDAAASDEVMELHEALVSLTMIARGRLSDYLREDGSVDITKVADGGPEIEDFQVVGTGQTQSARLKMRDPVKAIERLARLCGWDRRDGDEGPKFVFTFNVGPPADGPEGGATGNANGTGHGRHML